MFPSHDQEVLKEVDDGAKIRWRILKFDDSDSKALEEACIDAFNQLIKQTKDTLIDRLVKAEKEQEELESQDPDLWGKSCLSAVKKAKNALQKARGMSLIFAMSDVMAYAFESFESFIDAKKARVEAELEMMKQSVEV